MKRKLEDKPLKVYIEYEPASDGEGRLNKIFELLLSERGKYQRKKEIKWKKVKIPSMN